MDAFLIWADATVLKLSGKLESARAFRYTIARREALTRFVTGGPLEADNNVAENAMRTIALGRKNYIFADRMQAASGQRRSTPSWLRQSAFRQDQRGAASIGRMAKSSPEEARRWPLA